MRASRIKMPEYDIDEYTLLESSQMFDGVEAFLPTIGKDDLAQALNKIQQDAGVQLEMIASGLDRVEDLFASSKESKFRNRNFEPVTQNRMSPLFAEITSS